MFKPKNNDTEFNFWPSIADTLLAIFMVFLMLWLAEKLIFLQKLINCEFDKADKPPIINLPETLGFSFNSGHARLSEEFENLLKNDIVPKLRDIKDKHKVNVIEVIGHTDGVIAGGYSNLDEKLENAVAKGDISGLHYGSNADLGLMRALAVALFLRKQPELSGVTFRVYSAD
ncbi:protein containing Outer membrane protein, OmpA/MotB [Candidatus Thiomargarita nelsonii]|uniref:Protein containing Outer membrane protein, OmpA/MotB n=1 Tax=Candidatus Thiomargarita nelsonii TaxID=1003181 RepID=A0A176S363_9GAMM|nr:protein containing Outer membrane protein, OmpA/MotB [Candidatus Thiomargarita nelsonii]